MALSIQPFWPITDLQKLPCPPTETALALSFSTTVAPEDKDHCLALLDPSERARWERLKSPKASDEFLAGRSFLRRVLGQFTDRNPAHVRFSYNPMGRPELAPEMPRLGFNLSHSHGLGLLAVAQAERVGIDLEQIRPMADMMGLARRYFAARELAALEILDPSARLERFFSIWTSKEAFIKAHGAGVSYGLERVEIALADDGTPFFAQLAENDHPEDWSLICLEPATGFPAALVLHGRTRAVSCYHIDFTPRELA
jgi:4'-phosphopantetheinyl transferase